MKALRGRLRRRNVTIYRMWINGKSQTEIAREYGLTRQRVNAICTREAMRP